MKELLRRTCFCVGGEIALNGGLMEGGPMSSGRAAGFLDKTLSIKLAFEKEIEDQEMPVFGQCNDNEGMKDATMLHLRMEFAKGKEGTRIYLRP
jgi:hypothetical protein